MFATKHESGHQIERYPTLSIVGHLENHYMVASHYISIKAVGVFLIGKISTSFMPIQHALVQEKGAFFSSSN